MTKQDNGGNITYNVSGQNARINNRAIDNSTNVVNVNSGVTNQLSLLRSEVEQAGVLQDNGDSYLEVVDEIENQFALECPNKVVVKALVDSLPTVGNIASITSLLLAALG